MRNAHHALAVVPRAARGRRVVTAMGFGACVLEAAGAIQPGEQAVPERLSLGLDSVEWLQVQWFGNPVWQYVACLGYLCLAFLVARAVDAIFRSQLKRLAARSKTELDDLFVDLARGPVKVVAFVILSYLGLRALSWPEWAATGISNAVKVTVAASVGYVAVKGVDLLSGMWQRRLGASGNEALDRQVIPVLRKSLKVFVVVVAALVTAQNVGMDVTGLLASLSIGGLAVGLAAQDTLSNLFGAVSLFVDRPFAIGDRVQVDVIDGTVEEIGLRSTRIRNLDGHLVAIPNRTMANANITNVSRRPNIKTVMNVGVTYDTPVEKIERAVAILDEIFRPHPKTADLLISFNKFNDSSLNILVVHWWNSTDFKDYLTGFQRLNLEVKRRFDEEGIDFAFPTQTIQLRNGEVRTSGALAGHTTTPAGTTEVGLHAGREARP